jgi:hypothetical protein
VVRLKVSRRVRRFGVRGDDKGLLQGGGATVDNARPNDGVPLELSGEGLEESSALQGMDGRGGGLDGGVFVITEAERHVSSSTPSGPGHTPPES